MCGSEDSAVHSPGRRQRSWRMPESRTLRAHLVLRGGPMRMMATAVVVTVLSSAALAQTAPPTDSAKVIYVSAAELAAQVAKQPADRNGTISGLLQAPGYAVNIEH